MARRAGPDGEVLPDGSPLSKSWVVCAREADTPNLAPCMSLSTRGLQCFHGSRLLVPGEGVLVKACGQMETEEDPASRRVQAGRMWGAPEPERGWAHRGQLAAVGPLRSLRTVTFVRK